MALVNNISYCGKFSFDFFSPALFNNDIFSRFSPFEGVKNKMTLPNLSLSGHTVPDSCDFSPAGNTTLDPRDLTVCTFKVNDKICIQDIEPTFLSERLRLGSKEPVGPAEFTDYILDQLQRQIANNMQNLLWNGVAGATSGPEYLAECNGLLTAFGASGSGVLGSTGIGVTAGNVITVLSNVYSTIPAAVKSSGYPVQIFASQNVVDAYKLSQVNTNGGLLPTGEKALNFLGLEVVPTPFLPANNIVAMDPRNIAIGVDLMDDMQEVRVIDTTETLGENAIRIVARWKFGVQYRIGSEIVWFRP